MRIVVKVGTSTLAHATGALNIRRTAALCRVLADIKNAGHELVLVSSGAIGMGVGKLHLPGRPADMPSKQAAAAVGQCELMYRYDKLFSEYGHTVAQVLVTGEDARDEVRSANIEATLNRLLALGGGAGSAQGTGGMATKLSAARLATRHGVEMVIANGKKPEILYDILEGKPVGTRFSAQKGARA